MIYNLPRAAKETWPADLDTALEFASPEAFSISAPQFWGGKIEYTNGSGWKVWSGIKIDSSQIGCKNAIYLRGIGNTRIGPGATSRRWTMTGNNISCNGNIELLLDWKTVKNGGHPAMTDNCYAAMFAGCTGLTTAPGLPATTLANTCYAAMFEGCTGLTTAPALPATTLTDNCYASMFQGCTSLTTAPALPATTLAWYCYYLMFANCTGLTTAPDLPATTLADFCYYHMFEGCTSLTTAPALSATTLTDNCYAAMFKGCTSLTTAPALSATTLADSCYAAMFSSCTSLTTAPALPATTLQRDCYSSMFYGCTNLTTAPELPATTLAGSCYERMFNYCTSLTTAPTLPATTLQRYCYNYMFANCTNLTTAPALPATTLTDKCYVSMFYGCTNLTTAPELPATTLADSCYERMFNVCTALKSIPRLSATTLYGACYKDMFRGCKAIKVSKTKTGEYTNEYRIPTTGNGTTATNALTDMFTETGGAFIGTPAINTTYYLDSSIEVVGGFNTVTADKITKYFTVSNGSYYFAGSGVTFTSNNSGVDDSTATTTLTALQNMSIRFDYSYSSEKNYDKFTLIVAGTTVANRLSGATTRNSYSGSLKKGQQIVFKYVKDSSNHQNDDRCTFSNLQVKLQ